MRERFDQHETSSAFGEKVSADTRSGVTTGVHHVDVYEVMTVGDGERHPPAVSRVGMNHGIRDNFGNQ